VCPVDLASRPPARAWLTRFGPALVGLALGLLALGPLLGRGFVLSYDMVFVPDPPVSAATFGLAGGPPRAVPNDAVVAAIAHVIPADIAQKLILILIFVLACSGAAALVEGTPLLARLAAGVFYAWNPFVAERLLIGQWAFLLGYAGLPWVLRSFCRTVHIRLSRLCAALVPAFVGGWIAMSVTVLVAVPAALSRGTRRERARRLATVLIALGVVSLPWLIPAMLVPVHTDPGGVDAFAPRADTPFGRIGSLLMLGGIWNAETVPRGYGGPASVAWLLVVLAGTAGYVLWARPKRLSPGLGVAAAVGLLAALAGSASAGRELLRALIRIWPGFAMLRDGQQYLAPLALAQAVGIAALVMWVMRDLAAADPARAAPAAADPAQAADPARAAHAAADPAHPAHAAADPASAAPATADLARAADPARAAADPARAAHMAADPARAAADPDRATHPARAARAADPADAAANIAAEAVPAKPPATQTTSASQATKTASATLAVQIPSATRAAPAAVALALMAAVAPVLLVPGLALGAAGRLHAVQYPADWSRARHVIDGDPRSGSVLVLPWAAYRRYPWNRGEAVFDPWSKLLHRRVILNDALTVGARTVAAEDPDARHLDPVVRSPGPVTAALAAAGVRYVIVDAGPFLAHSALPRTAPPRFAGASVVLASDDLVLLRLPPR
jgi:hypothetical protein